MAEAVTAWSGRLVELRGDEALAVFGSPPMALRAACELQDAFADEVTADPTLPLRVGIGLDVGIDQARIETAWEAGAAWELEEANAAARLILERAGVDSTSPDPGV